jgi:hypothetical protein
VLTEIVHRSPRGWYPQIDQLHELLQAVGPEKIEQACRAAAAAGSFTVAFIQQCLGGRDRALRLATRVSA